jgi:DNA polymerase elongation subunit (family B)
MVNNHTVLLDNGVKKELMKRIKDDLKFYRFYNIDFNPAAYALHDFKKKEYREPDPQSKILNKTYYDIEIWIDPPYFPDPDKAARPVNAVATYNSISNTATVYYLSQVESKLSAEPEADPILYPNITCPDTIQHEVNELYNITCENNEAYYIPGITIKTIPFKDEVELLTTFFKDRIEEQSLFLVGFNNELFDDPYLVNRLNNLIGKEKAAGIISEFAQVQKRGNTFDWPDYIKVDLLSLYKPVDQMGGGLGKSLPNYKLNTICEEELKINKLDLPGGFNDNYLNNIVGYLTYNLFDAILVYLLDEKLKFMELQWSLNNYNNSIMSATTNGRSLMYTFRNNLHHVKENNLLRFKKLNKEVYYDI